MNYIVYNFSLLSSAAFPGGRLFAGIAGSNLAKVWMLVSCVCCVGSGLYEGLIIGTEECYRVCVCV
jgi:hypothetical protein